MNKINVRVGKENVEMTREEYAEYVKTIPIIERAPRKEINNESKGI